MLVYLRIIRYLFRVQSFHPCPSRKLLRLGLFQQKFNMYFRNGIIIVREIAKIYKILLLIKLKLVVAENKLAY